MTLVLTDRRRILRAGLGFGLAAALPGTITLPAFAQWRLRPTPAQTEGPYYPDRFPADVDNDLVEVAGRGARGAGTVTHLIGRVTDTLAVPLAGLTVEIWQCDAQGAYRHSRDPRSGAADANFQGYGHTQTAADGGYRFRTIQPVPYPGRTPHIHLAVSQGGRRRLVTQVYVAGFAGNENDGVFRSVRSAEDRALLLARFEPAVDLEQGALRARFDIVLA
jgi:protocatechuate 3,4-dioxygenase beta subunit